MVPGLPVWLLAGSNLQASSISLFNNKGVPQGLILDPFSFAFSMYYIVIFEQITMHIHCIADVLLMTYNQYLIVSNFVIPESKLRDKVEKPLDPLCEESIMKKLLTHLYQP